LPAGFVTPPIVKVQVFDDVGVVPDALVNRRLVPEVPGPVVVPAVQVPVQDVPEMLVKLAEAKLAPFEFTPAEPLAAQLTDSRGESQISNLIAWIAVAELVTLGVKVIAYDTLVAPALSVAGLALRAPI
jgi:hypothetical protein